MAPLSVCSPEELWSSIIVKNTFLDVDEKPMYDRRIRASSTPPALRFRFGCEGKALHLPEPDDDVSTEDGETASTGDANSVAGDLE
mmetsp:Transcript_98587/g.256935  ORF Transcript_98587/g.256935 Transcript_98587/m.256935 type:complete len:86 (+) Transcript_98587:114-371(+)